MKECDAAQIWNAVFEAERNGIKPIDLPQGYAEAGNGYAVWNDINDTTPIEAGLDGSLNSLIRKIL